MQSTLNCIKFMILFVLSLGLAACANDSTGPELKGSQTAVITASVEQMVSPNGATLMFGTDSIDADSWDLGQTLLGQYEFYFSIDFALEGSEVASLFYATNGAGGIVSDGNNSVSVKVLSDWKAVDPDKHRGVAYTNMSEFYFRVEGYGINADGNINWEARLPTRFYKRTSFTPNSSVQLTLNPERSVRFVFVAQRRSMGCSGNDSLTVRSQNGLMQTFIGTENSDNWLSRTTIDDVTIRCSVYDGEPQGVRMPPSLLRTDETPKMRIEMVEGRYYMKLQ